MSEIVEVDKTNNVIYVIDKRLTSYAVDAPGPLDNIDWLDLAKQKTALLKLIWGDESHPLWGLINLIDAIQDDAEARGNPVVYGYDLEMYKEEHQDEEIPDGNEDQTQH